MNKVSLSKQQITLVTNVLAQRLGFLISVGADDDRVQEISEVIRVLGNSINGESDQLPLTAKNR